jgi:hypothetical protein
MKIVAFAKLEFPIFRNDTQPGTSDIVYLDPEANYVPVVEGCQYPTTVAKPDD